jgi:hypothetical protein
LDAGAAAHAARRLFLNQQLQGVFDEYDPTTTQSHQKGSFDKDQQRR